MLGAMERELVALRRKMRIEDVVHDGPFPMWSGRYGDRQVVLVRTRIGPRNATAAATRVLERFPCTALVSMGFGGALAPDLGVGDVVVCERLCTEDSADRTLEADPRLVQACTQHGGRLSGSVNTRVGTSVSVRLPVCTRERRAQLAKDCGACLVDMESYWIGSISLSQRVPFVCVRSVSDTANEELPPLDRLVDSDGRWKPATALRYFTRRPWKLASLVRLRRHCQAAARGLAVLLDSLLPALPVGQT
ncbi:MAG: hypothetical protein ACOC58_03700 [Chloroflexota bacterium]